MTNEEISNLTRPQFKARLEDIGEIQKMFDGQGKGRISHPQAEKKRLMDMAANIGLSVPSK